jgi:hypothetical protein
MPAKRSRRAAYFFFRRVVFFFVVFFFVVLRFMGGSPAQAHAMNETLPL